MRAVISVLVIALVAIIAAIATGFLDINQIRSAQAPQISTTQNGVVAKGGQTPSFDIETGSVKVGAQDTQVKIPSLQVQRPPEPGANQPAANQTTNAM
jgi:hypothetical protein